MPLEVTVISYRGRSPDERLDARFDRDGGTIGRSTSLRGNHLTLPDPERYISRRHARIEFDKGRYTLTDTSVDGTFVNDRNRRINRETVPLADGDRLWIGEYELQVRMLTNGDSESADGRVAFGDGGGFFADDAPDGHPRTMPSAGSGDRADNRDWWSEGDIFDPPADDGTPGGPADASPLHDAFAPPDVVEERGRPTAIPADFDFGQLLDDTAPPPAQPAPADPAQPSSGGPPMRLDEEAGGSEASMFDLPEPPAGTVGPFADRAPPPSVPSPASSPATVAAEEAIRERIQGELVRMLLDAAGIKGTDASEPPDLPRLMASIGAALRETVEGLMRILRGRTELKTQLRVEATRIKPTDNNPLKFYRDVDEALEQMMVGSRPGFVDARTAVSEAFTDIMHHQMAMHAGLQAAVIDLLGRFDPQHFAKPYAEGVVFQKKAKAWEDYQEAYARIAGEALESFFGKPFADAYERQIRKLKSKPE